MSDMIKNQDKIPELPRKSIISENFCLTKVIGVDIQSKTIESYDEDSFDEWLMMHYHELDDFFEENDLELEDILDVVYVQGDTARILFECGGVTIAYKRPFRGFILPEKSFIVPDKEAFELLYPNQESLDIMVPSITIVKALIDEAMNSIMYVLDVPSYPNEFQKITL